MEEKVFSWFSLLPFYNEGYAHIYASILVMAIIVITGTLATRFIGKGDDLLPEGRFSFRDIYEIIIGGILEFMEDIMGHKAKEFMPLIGTIFILILISNLMGIIPGFTPPTTNLNTNAAYALTVFVATHYYGVKAHGIGYLKHFAGPVWWLAILMVPLELMGHLFRPVSLSLRLFGNMNGDHMVLEIFSHLVPFGIPVVFIVLAIFVSFIQAFIFTLLSILYISVAIEH